MSDTEEDFEGEIDLILSEIEDARKSFSQALVSLAKYEKTLRAALENPSLYDFEKLKRPGAWVLEVEYQARELAENVAEFDTQLTAHETMAALRHAKAAE